MATEKQIAANRANAKKSTGPRTDLGKLRSSVNATRDALTAQVALMPGEDRSAHDAFCAELLQSLAPEGPFETQLAQSIAEDNWRINRIRAVETTLFAFDPDQPAFEGPLFNQAAAPARAYSADPHRFQLITLYIQRTNREIHRNLKLLRELQAERRAAPPAKPPLTKPSLTPISMK